MRLRIIVSATGTYLFVFSALGAVIERTVFVAAGQQPELGEGFLNENCEYMLDILTPTGDAFEGWDPLTGVAMEGPFRLRTRP